jgi:hypothetical protein
MVQFRDVTVLGAVGTGWLFVRVVRHRLWTLGRSKMSALALDGAGRNIDYDYAL